LVQFQTVAGGLCDVRYGIERHVFSGWAPTNTPSARF
jgi:hypothetical protein